MAITVEFLKGLGIDDDVASKIFAERGKEVNKDKQKIENLESELQTKSEAFDKMKTDFESLKTKNASAEDYEKKFNDLQVEIAEREKKAKEEAEQKEKADMLNNRFNAVVGERKFNHEAIKKEYLRKFGEALDDKENASKSDKDIFDSLIKDDNSAFEGIKPIITGAQKQTTASKYKTKEEILQIKDGATRRQAMAENIDLFE